jgi:hypothetical protein
METLQENDIYKGEYGAGVVSPVLIGKPINKEYQLIKRAKDIKTFFSVGDRIGGFCNGYFGRDDYKIKTCVAVFNNFAVFQYQDGSGEILNYPKDMGLKFWAGVEIWRIEANNENT